MITTNAELPVINMNEANRENFAHINESELLKLIEALKQKLELLRKPKTPTGFRPESASIRMALDLGINVISQEDVYLILKGLRLSEKSEVIALFQQKDFTLEAIPNNVADGFDPSQNIGAIVIKRV